MGNPFSLTFGKKPESLIGRSMQMEEVINSFEAENPTYQACMITGIRGSGKTVFLTSLSNEFKQKENWIVVSLNPERDMLNSLAAELSNRKEFFEMFRDAKINLSFLGFGLEIDGVPPITDVVVALDRMLKRITAQGKKILITIDEVVVNKNVKEFMSQFQIFLREEYSIFLIMTGLYKNIYDLQNTNTLTFLYRTPKLVMEPLGAQGIMQKYKEIFDIENEKAYAMAKLTKGYPFAYQLLGYLCYKNDAEYDKVLGEFDATLSMYVYEKIWSELSVLDKTVMQAIGEHKGQKVEIIRKSIGMESGEFNVYRTRLLKAGLIWSPAYGMLDLTLPRFDVFMKYLF